MLPAFAAAEALLRGECHPNFIKWTMSNSNKPRVVFMKTLAMVLILLGFALSAVLILSRSSRFIRLSAWPLWCVGFMFLMTSRHGFCFILHWNYKRNLRPWEQFADEDVGSVHEDEDVKDTKGFGDGLHEKTKGHKKEVSIDSVSRVDPLRKPSLRSLGPANSFDEEPWVEHYQNKSAWKKVFEVSVMTQNKHLRTMQNRLLFRAMLWSSLLASVLSVASIFIPSGKFF